MKRTPGIMKGHSSNLDRLVEEQHEDLLRFAVFICRDFPLAQDITQETWAVALPKLRRAMPAGDPGKWLRGIARNIYRKACSQRKMLPLSEELLLASEQYWEKQVQFPYLDALQECLKHLADEYQEVLRLRYQGGLGRKAIADILGLGIAGVESRLKRARRQLKECIERKLFL